MLGVSESDILCKQFLTDRDGLVLAPRRRYVPASEAKFRVDPAVAERQFERLKQVRASRDEARAQQPLARLEEVAASDQNTIPTSTECMENYVTLGEICDVLRKVLDEQKEFMLF